ncbi:plexin domain containing lethal (1) G0289 [Rhynchophorus ferrugineus]|uniref:plexin domain containing lethal (1) G0289 n=1 Tax=Rhynchophorus ferrugineus TaxID=354439 RepID=UPI003FCD2EC5
MAKDSRSLGSLRKCVFGLVFFVVLSTALSEDIVPDVFLDKDHSLFHYEVFDDHNLLYRRFKRDKSITSIKNTSITTIASTEIPTTTHQFVQVNESKPIEPSSNSSSPLIVPGQRLLGVNGTGQQKWHITQILPDATLQNVTSSVNTAVKNITLIATNEASDEASKDILTDDLPPEDLNNALENARNMTVKTDTHVFYNSTIYNEPEVGKEFWVDMDKRTDVKVSDLLSSSHRRAATIKLSFEFPFYGHYIKNVTVATGGFLYTGNYVHSWLAATQYIAPLMANFDTGLSNDSYIKFADNGTSFTVEWDSVLLQDKPDDGEFTFQTTLHQNGDIVFVYKNVPLLIKDINDDHHPVKVGLSDAYILDKTIFFVRRKTIYEYHRVAFKKEEIRNWTAIFLKALPNCLDYRDCKSCVMAEDLECQWCPSLNQCSAGKDRNRQDWIDKGCDLRNISQEAKCGMVFDDKEYITKNSNYDVEKAENSDADFIGHSSHSSQLGASGYVVVAFLIAMLCGFGYWTAYAYRNPHTTSGQMLIRYRPSQWRWRRGEARYTAATIHM